MKRLFLAFAFFTFASLTLCEAQNPSLDLPVTSLIPHYRLFVSFTTTTVLVFPSMVKPVDRGDRDIIVQKQAGVENILKVKAARRGFMPTNLHVFTGDGSLYAFDVYYTDSLATTHNLAALVPVNTFPNASLVVYSSNVPNALALDRLIAEAKDLPALRIATSRHDEMKFSLRAIGMSDHLLFFRLKLTNNSPLDYTIDFFRLYIRDRQKAKRSSVQEQQLYPVYEDSTRTVAGGTAVVQVIAVPVFSLPEGKEFRLEVFEKNGGRSLSIGMTNKELFKLKLLK
jgi:conjugative transposon TraN protein